MNFEEILGKSGYSSTQPRQLIFVCLQNSPKPLTIDELRDLVPLTDRSTVYRTVAMFEELGIIKRVWFGKKSKLELSDQYQKHHHHLVCESCGTVIKFTSKDLEKQILKVTNKYKHQHNGHTLEIFGLCQSCRSRA